MPKKPAWRYGSKAIERRRRRWKVIGWLAICVFYCWVLYILIMLVVANDAARG